MKAAGGLLPEGSKRGRPVVVIAGTGVMRFAPQLPQVGQRLLDMVEKGL